MLGIIAAVIGFLGASLIGFAVTGGAKRPQAFAIIGTALTVVALILFLLIAFKVVNVSTT